MKKLGLFAVLLLLAAAIWWLSSQGKFSSQNDRMLHFVPADTPYVIGMLEPLPEDVSRSYLQLGEDLVGLYGQLMEPLITELRQSDKPEDAKSLAIIEALSREFENKTLAQSIEDLGLSLRSHSAVYGVGLVPVARIELASPDKFRAFVARMEAAAGTPMPVADIDGTAYWRLQPPETPLMLVAAIIDTDLVLTLAPGDANRTALRAVLGLDRPADSLAASGGLQALNNQYGFVPFASGFIDSQRLLRALTEGNDPVEQAFLTALQIDKPELNPTCKAEFESIAEAWPRLVVGYTRYDTRANDMLWVLETRQDIADSLMKLRAPLPGAGASSEKALINIGLALKLSALPGVVDGFANKVAQSPYQCEQLAALNMAFAEGRKQINNPGLYGVAPMANAIHILVDSLDLGAMALSAEQPKGEIRVAIGSDNPSSLVGMSKSFVPQLAEFNLAADGQAVALPALPGMPPELSPQIAMSNKALALSSHAAGADTLSQLLSLDEAQQPILLFGMRSAVYAQFADAVEKSFRDSLDKADGLQLEQDEALAEDAEAAAEAAQRRADKRKQGEAMLEMQMRLMREVYPKLFSRMESRIEFTARGIELRQQTTLP
ncbi:hypothetical protein [Pseudomarimonas arenosa]|uniref:DUF3352 domain-containing protein n=1 Tax=Pseudomarimonas arenosa TaxID=2774145 RepID=A0AAW3ZP75_9GAMM|nr:hypothetical protein [Pseudomarimonas arenosa]MBD8527758.1 hypothetical protein [Pseudomarimonas arenosa]